MHQSIDVAVKLTRTKTFQNFTSSLPGQDSNRPVYAAMDLICKIPNRYPWQLTLNCLNSRRPASSGLDVEVHSPVVTETKWRHFRSYSMNKIELFLEFREGSGRWPLIIRAEWFAWEKTNISSINNQCPHTTDSVVTTFGWNSYRSACSENIQV